MSARASFVLVLLAGLAISGCRPAPATEDTAPIADPVVPLSPTDAAISALENFRARGNEPFWVLELDAMALAWRPMDGGERVFSHLVHEPHDQGIDISATLDGAVLALRIENRLCRDSMSGMPFPHSVTVRVDDGEFHGCGGEAITLLTANGWTVTQLFGVATSADPPTLRFTADGRANGFAGCNTWMSATRLSGEGLAIDRAASTMMACPEDTMAQEREFLDALSKVTRHDFDATGRLLLKAGDVTLIVAAPQG